MEKVEDLVGCDVTVEGGVLFMPSLSSVPFHGTVHVAGIQHHDGHELYLQLPDKTFVRLTAASRITGWVRSRKIVESVIMFHDPKNLHPDEKKLYQHALAQANLVKTLSRREGAAVCLANGDIVSDRTMWGDTLCPEAKVLVRLQEKRGRLPDVRKIAITGPLETLDDPDPLVPCGSCRQKILACQEEARGPIVVLFSGGYGQVARVENIEALLPFARVGGAGQ